MGIERNEIHIEKDEQDRIIGYVWLKDKARRQTTEIHEIVSSAKGCGRKLFDWVCQHATHRTLELIVWEQNRHAIGVYRHLGFKTQGIKRICGKNYIEMTYAISE